MTNWNTYFHIIQFSIDTKANHTAYARNMQCGIHDSMNLLSRQDLQIQDFPCCSSGTSSSMPFGKTALLHQQASMV
jgi:hypothetical protein